MAFKAKSSKDMYKDSPKLERGEDGKVGVKKVTEAERVANKENEQTSPMPVHEEMMARHSNDRHMMHAKHEHEHAIHKMKHKHEMHKRHESEIKDMHRRHEKEMDEGGREDAMTRGAEIEKEGE
jgi:hypothetical protein